MGWFQSKSFLHDRKRKNASIIRNILVVSEFYSAGGLETQICSQARYLDTQGVKLHLVTSSPSSASARSIFSSTVFDLPMHTDAETLLKSSQKLLDLIDELKIDLIHAHPFFSLALALIVAHRKNIPLVATLHGPSSLVAAEETTLSILLRKALLQEANMLIAVSPEVKLLAHVAAPCAPVVIPNAVEFHTVINAVPKHAPWLWAGRLDQEKTIGLRALIAEVLRQKQTVLHIYGSGPEEFALRQELEEQDPESNWVVLKGWDDHLADRMWAYSLIAGMGRVLLEGAAAGRPCLLVGYDGIKGIMTPADMAKAAYWNFSGRGLRTISSAAFDEQLRALHEAPQQYSLYEWVARHHSAERVWQDYLDKISALNGFSSTAVEAFISCLKHSGSSDAILWADHQIYTMFCNICENQGK